MKTARQVQTDFYNLLKNSELSKAVNGSVYQNGMRPRSSESEDIVVIHTAGNAEQEQEGIVTITIFVPDIAPFKNGVKVENSKRTGELETLAYNWFNSLDSSKHDYLLKLERIIATYADYETEQHFVSVQINYKILSE